MKPSILMVTGEYPPRIGGVGDYTALLSSHLAELGARVVVLTTGEAAPGPFSIESRRRSTIDGQASEPLPPPQTSGSVATDHVRVLRLDRPWGFSSWMEVASAALQSCCQIVHIQYQAAAFGMHLAANLLPGYLRLRLPRAKSVVTFHDLRVPYLLPKAGPLRRGAILALDALSHTCVVTNQADLHALGGPGAVGSARKPKRWLIPIASNIPCSPPQDFDRQRWRRLLGIDDDTFLLCYFGFMNDSKGVEFLLSALQLLAARGVNARLLILGGETGDIDPSNRAYSERIERLVVSLHLEDRVHWTGFLPPQEVSAALLSCDLCVLPFRDGASLRRGSLLAAIAHGVPTLTTIPEQDEPLLADGENVAMVERDSPEALARAIGRLQGDAPERHRLAEGASALASRFTWPDIARRHLQLYDTLLE